MAEGILFCAIIASNYRKDIVFNLVDDYLHYSSYTYKRLPELALSRLPKWNEVVETDETVQINATLAIDRRR